MTNREIGCRLKISPATVKRHLEIFCAGQERIIASKRRYFTCFYFLRNAKSQLVPSTTEEKYETVFFISLAGVLAFYIAHSTWSAEKEPAKDAPKPTPPTYVGTEVCQACHAPAFEKFSATVMGKIFLHSPRNETEKQACENCHGPGSNHVAAGRQRDRRHDHVS